MPPRCFRRTLIGGEFSTPDLASKGDILVNDPSPRAGFCGADCSRDAGGPSADDKNIKAFL
jgi:hypothetical protein